MRNTNASFINKCMSESALWEIIIKIGEDTITDTIDNFVFTEMIDSNNTMTFGNVCANEITFDIYNPSRNISGADIVVGAKIKGSTINIGKYKVINATKNREVVSYRCVDYMATKLDSGYIYSESVGNTDIDILNDIATVSGLSVVTSGLTSHTLSEIPTGYTKREMISFIAQLQGKNAYVNNDTLAFKWYSNVNYTINDSRIYMDGSLDIKNTSYSITKLTCNSSDGEITSGDGTHNLTFSNPLMTQIILDEVFNKVKNLVYYGITMDCLGDFNLECGDIITVITGGKTYKVPIMQITHSWDGGVRDTIVSSGVSDEEGSLDLTGITTREFDRYSMEMASINKAMINKLDVDTAQITYATIENLNAANGNIQNLQTNKMDANFGNIDNANLNKANIGQMFANVGLITSATIKDGHVTGSLDAIEVNANSITSGTLKTERLVLVGSDTSIVYEINRLNGTTQLSESTIDGGSLTDRTITADKLIANTITANEINMENLTGSSAFLNSLEVYNNSVTVGGRNYLDGSKTMLDLFVSQFLIDESGNRLTDSEEELWT